MKELVGMSQILDRFMRLNIDMTLYPLMAD